MPSGSNIAIIDVARSLRQALGRLLSLSGFTVRTCEGAESFLGDEAQGAISLVVADLHFGGMSGIELQQHLHRERPGLPVVFIAALESPLPGGSGAIPCLRKPFSGSHLVEPILASLGSSPDGAATAPGTPSLSPP
jgi:FixJ family two-component response regulator